MLILGLRDIEETRPRLEGSIGATLSLIAADQNKKGKDIALSTEKVAGVTIRSFGPIEQFTPAYAFIGPYLVASSSRLIVREVAQVAAGNGQSLAQAAAFGELITSDGNPKKATYVDISRVADLLEDFKEQLINGDVSKKGKSREQAEQDITSGIELLRLLGTLRGVTSTREGRITTMVELSSAASE